MSKKILTAEQIREEVHRRIYDGSFAHDRLPIRVPFPTAHSVDAQERNWDMKEDDHGERGQYFRRVVDAARHEFLLSDAAERDEILGDSFAHG